MASISVMPPAFLLAFLVPCVFLVNKWEHQGTKFKTTTPDPFYPM